MAILKNWVLAAVAAGTVFTGLSFGGDDTTPPQLKSLQFTPASIDTSTGTAEVTLSYSVSDDASGVTYFEAAFVDASGMGHQSASARFAPTLAATNSVKVTFPRFSNSGTWTLVHVFVSDAAGNTLILDGDGLSGRGLPTRLEVKSARDTVSPKLTALAISPAQIDTSAGPAAVKVNYTATDDLSGVQHIDMSFLSPSGAAWRGESAKLDAAQSVSKSMTVTFPPHSEAGQWTLSHVFLADAAGNTLILNGDGLAQLGFQTALEVKSVADTTPPRLTDLRFAPEAIDTSGGPATVKVDFTATDDLSGVNFIDLSFVSPAGNVRHNGSVRFDPARSVSKSMVVTFPRLSEAGEWTLDSVFLADAAGNTLVLDAEGVVRAGLRTKLEVKSTTDTIPPSLTSLRFDPEAIDTSRGPVSVKVDFTATDDLSGVRSFEVVLESPSGNAKQGASAVFAPATSVSESVRVTFPRSSEPGIWKLRSIMVGDAAGNTLVLDAEALAYKVSKGLHVN
jgi:hypothetical protein